MSCPLYFKDFESIALYSDAEEVAKKFKNKIVHSKEDLKEYTDAFERILAYEPKNQEKKTS